MNENRIETIERVFNQLGPHRMEVIDEFYGTEVVFEDPVGKIQGRDALKAYYQDMYENVQEIRFDFKEHVTQNDTTVSVWTMHLRAKKLNGGETISLEGNSLMRFDSEQKVVYHRDYFDMGEFIYEHVPVLGFLVRQVRGYFKHRSR